MLPFTHDQFLDVFARYNVAAWPAQVLAYLLAAAMIAALVRPAPASGRLIGSGLAAMWLWTGIGYHWMYFADINKAAWLFGAIFVAQGLLLLFVTVVRDRIRFASTNNLSSWVGWLFVAYAVVIYPLLGLATGSEYPGMPMFGITPCPVTIFTFGLLLLASSAVRWWCSSSRSSGRSSEAVPRFCCMFLRTGSCCSAESSLCRSSCADSVGKPRRRPDGLPGGCAERRGRRRCCAAPPAGSGRHPTRHERSRVAWPR